MSTETLDKLYLELSNITGARNGRECALYGIYRDMMFDCARKDTDTINVSVYLTKMGHILDLDRMVRKEALEYSELRGGNEN